MRPHHTHGVSVHFVSNEGFFLAATLKTFGLTRGRPGRPNARRLARRGSAVLEMAVAFPVLLFVAFGLVEFGQYLYIKHCFQAAARDAARVAIMANATQAQVNSTLTNTLAQAGVTYNPSWLTITDLGPASGGSVSDVANVPIGDQMQFTLSVQYSSIPNAVRPFQSLTGVGIGTGKSVAGVCTMVKE